MITVLDRLSTLGVIPVVTITKLDTAIPIARALCQGGIDCIEIMRRTDLASQAIEEIKKELPGMLVGAGSILNGDEVHELKVAGADFIVGPGLYRDVIEACSHDNIYVIPGIFTATDIQQAWNLDKELAGIIIALKLFPARFLTVQYLKDVAAPFRGRFRFVPTGGINLDNMGIWLQEKTLVAAVGGSWLVEQRMVENELWDEITAQAVRTADRVKAIRSATG